jgi:2-oxo-4-hydroxy-4-carboxy-5-ureidoimidazoline decarboxylase
MNVAQALDALGEREAGEALARCCGASRWVRTMLAHRPFADDEALFAAADRAWSTMERADILEAFSHHPRIGSDLEALRAKYASTAGWSADEQRGALSASEHTLTRLRDGNQAYEARFGHIFIVCATGKSADEMLSLLEARLGNEPLAELAIAAAEQHKITRLRLAKLGDDSTNRSARGRREAP